MYYNRLYMPSLILYFGMLIDQLNTVLRRLLYVSVFCSTNVEYFLMFAVYFLVCFAFQTQFISKKKPDEQYLLNSVCLCYYIHSVKRAL